MSDSMEPIQGLAMWMADLGDEAHGERIGILSGSLEVTEPEVEPLKDWKWPSGIVSTITFKLEDVPQETLKILVGPPITHKTLATWIREVLREKAVKGCEHCTRNQVYLRVYARAADLLADRLMHPCGKDQGPVRLGYWLYANYNIQLHNDQIRAAIVVAARACEFNTARNTVIEAGKMCAAEGETS